MGEMKRSLVTLALNKLDGTFTMTTKKLENLFCVYYNELYDDVPMNLETKRLKEKITMAIPKKFTHSMNNSLVVAITKGEFQLQPRLWPKEKPQVLMG
jgi:hypothetical protein